MSPSNPFLVLLVALALIQQASNDQPEPHRAGLVVVHGDGTIIERCVEFSEDSITGVELLQQAGLELVVGAYGGLGYGICAIDGEGCLSEEDCFCQCRGSPCSYWVYSHRRPDDTWVISGVGASTWKIRQGDIDGWVWGDGSEAPPQVTFADVCPTEADEKPTLAGLATGATITPAPLPTPVSSTPTLSSSKSDRLEPEVGTEQRRANPWSYALFGLIIIALGSGLIIARRRGS